MKNDTKKFLEFNGKTIYFVAADGQYWIAIKPICEALGVDYERQRKNLKEEEILAQLPSEQAVVAADNKLRKMLCLPEFYIYGWIFNIQSSSPELLKYKWECYRVLYDYFHGAIIGRKSLLREKAKLKIEIDSVFNRMPVQDSLLLSNAARKLNRINIQLRSLDGEIIQEERNLFNI
jgi:hypothetical protein